MVAYSINFINYGYHTTYLVNRDEKVNPYTEEQVISMLEFLFDNIFDKIGCSLFKQIFCIPMGNN